ncbi:MAG: ribosome-associated heat shock protein Hsp15 [Paracoccaceae bacterium]|jgi:ribosome-associated heat shock protein Hsp15
MDAPLPKQRLDKWLFQARFFKTRSLAAKQVSGGHVRVNDNRAGKPAHGVAPGDVLTFAQGRQVRVVRIEALAERRGPAPEAQALYVDLSPESEDPSRDADKAHDPASRNPRYDGKGRPDKRDRRALERSRRQTGE